MSIDDGTVVHLLKEAVPDVPHPPDRYARIVARAGQQRHRRLTEGLGALCVALVVLGSVIAIDRRSPAATPADVLVAAVGRAEDVGTARFESEYSVDVGGMGGAMVVSGAIDFRTGEIDAQTTFRQGNDESPNTMRFRIADGVQYVGIPEQATAARRAGKRWIGSPATTRDLESEISDPAKMLADLEAAAGSLDRLGRETVRGVKTTHYRLGLVDGRAIEGFGADDLIKRAEVWIADDGLPRKMLFEVADLDGETETLTEGRSALATMEFFDYGARLDIEPPPAAEVIARDDPLLTADAKSAQTCVSAKLKELFEQEMAAGATAPAEAKDEFARRIQAAQKACGLDPSDWFGTEIAGGDSAEVDVEIEQ